MSKRLDNIARKLREQRKELERIGAESEVAEARARELRNQLLQTQSAVNFLREKLVAIAVEGEDEE